MKIVAHPVKKCKGNTDDIFFDAPPPSGAILEEDEFLRYMVSEKDPLSRQEKDVLDFAEFKHVKERRQVSVSKP